MKKILLSLLVLYSILGFFVLPWVAKSQIVKIVEQNTNSKLQIENISFNPFLFKLQLEYIQLTSIQNKPLVNFKSLYIDVELYSLFTRTIHIKDILLHKPEIFVALSKEKKLNLLSILKEEPEKLKKETSESMKLPRVVIDNIKLIDGDMDYEDYTKNDKYTFDFHDIGFSLKDIDTKNLNANDAKLHFYSSLGDGGFIELQTKLLEIVPLTLDGTLNFQASKLYSPWKYVKDMLNLEVADGKVSLSSHFKMNLDDLNATIIDKVALSVDKLRVIPKNGYQDVLTLHKLNLENATIKPFMQDIIIDKISLNELHIDAKRNKKEQIDCLEYVKLNSVKTKETESENNTTKSKPWSVLLRSLDLKNISAKFEDKSIYPNVTTKLNSLNIHAKDITLAGEKPFAYKLDMLLNEKFQCNADGKIGHKKLNISTHLQCENFDVVHYRPYLDKLGFSELKVYDVSLERAKIGFDTKVSVKELEKEFAINVTETNATLSKLLISKRSNRKTLLSLNALKVSELSLDVGNKKLDIGKVYLRYPIIYTVRDTKGVMNFENIVIPKVQKRDKEKPFDVALKHFAIYNARVDFKDETLSPSLTNTMDKINFHAYNLNIKKNTWLSYQFSSRVNKKGSIESKGRLRHTPLKEKSSIKIANIALKNLTPYVQQKAFVAVADGKLFIDAKTEYGASKKMPDLKVEGKVALVDLFLNDSRDNTSIFSINGANVSAFTFELNPDRLYVDKLTLKSFYIDTLIDEKKEMNYVKLIKPSDTNMTQDSNTTKFPINIAKIKIEDGNVKFADYSIPLKFKTDIHDLNGDIYSVSNDTSETSYVDIDGAVDKYGATKLKGSINSANPKEFTDLSFNFKNLNLHSLSGYSASFAGHEIDEGKLFLDLGYKIKNSKLVGENSIIIKNIKLGKENDDENVTKLPLGSVIGLLEDSDGVIDIDMPIEGNLDEPDFKYGALVWKTFGNLIVRAVSSPFRFLGSLMGLDGDALAYAAFEAGSNKISPTEREKLDNVAKIMVKRPKIELKITPIYDDKLDKKALQRHKLINLVMKKSGITNEEEHQTAMTVDMLEEIYKEYKYDNALDVLAKKVKKTAKEDRFERDYLSGLIQLCVGIQVVNLQELEGLAEQRASALKQYLVKEKSILDSKISIQKTSSIGNSQNNVVKIGLKVEVK